MTVSAEMTQALADLEAAADAKATAAAAAALAGVDDAKLLAVADAQDEDVAAVKELTAKLTPAADPQPEA